MGRPLPIDMENGRSTEGEHTIGDMADTRRALT